MQNHLSCEFEMLRKRLFNSNDYNKLRKFCVYTRNGEHNSATWLVGHAGFIADIMILKAWDSHGKCDLIIDKNFGFSSNGKTSIQLPFNEVYGQVSSIFNDVRSRLAEENCEHFLTLRSSYPEHCISDKHLVIHAIQDIAYHLGQLNFIISGKTLV